jgi:hypothetical protein
VLCVRVLLVATIGARSHVREYDYIVCFCPLYPMDCGYGYFDFLGKVEAFVERFLEFS